MVWSWARVTENDWVPETMEAAVWIGLHILEILRIILSSHT
jgi:type IV secretory pathway TrbL component